MKTPLRETTEAAHIAELTRQRDALLRKVELLSEIVRTVPSMLMSARLDEREGKNTSYNYWKHGKALNAPEA